MSRSPGSYRLPLAAGAVVLAVSLPGAGVARAQTTGGGSGSVRNVQLPVRDLTFPVIDAVSQTSTPTQTQVTLASDVFFDFDKSDLTAAAQQLLAQLVPQIASQTKGPVQIDGYTDSIGNAGYNQTLSQQRADAVKAAVGKLFAGTSVAARQLVSAGHGASNFVAPNTNPDGTDNPAGRAKNRRVTITYPIA